SEQRRFSVYRWSLTAASKQEAAGSSPGRALPELLLCGDFSNPWYPVHHERDAIESWRARLGAGPDDCAVRGRAAIGEMLVAGGAAGRAPGPADLAQAGALLSGGLGTGPGCEGGAGAGH